MAKKKKKGDWRGKLAFAIFFAMCIVFYSTGIILLVGMLPTIVAFIVDRSKEKLKPLTVGAMNLAGCFPFVLELWIADAHDLTTAINIAMNARTISIIYLAAVIGYLIDWAMTGIVAELMKQKAQGRLKEIDKQQAKLIERWGPEVRGDIQLDAQGYPFDATETLKEN